jgi:glycosyltransferase involved in cell wall biosynthesis
LHAHFAHNPTSLARYASQMTGIPFSFTAHAKDLYLTRPESLINKAELASFITTCTGFNARYLCDILPPESARKVNVVYHGVDTHRFCPGRHEGDRFTPALLSVGRLVPKKGFACLIEAARLLHDESIPFRLDIYGSGPLKDDLQRQIDRAGLAGQIQLRGATTQDELLAAYATADIFVLAPQVTVDGDRDGIPNVLLEAMACGLPVVSTDISGIPEVIADGVNGRLVPSADPRALAMALRGLLASGDDRRSFGEEARRTMCGRFDAGVNAETMASLLVHGGRRCE